MLAGLLVTGGLSIERKIIWMFTIGFFSFIIGGVWDWFFPINKNLWSSSFVMYTSGAAALTLATSLFVVDVLQIKGWTRVGRIFGANAITVYVIAGMLPSLFGWEILGGHSLNSLFMNGLMTIGFTAKLASLCYALIFTAVCYIPAYWLYKKKIFIKL